MNGTSTTTRGITIVRPRRYEVGATMSFGRRRVGALVAASGAAAGDSHAARAARAMPRCRFEVGLAESLPVPNGGVNVVVSSLGCAISPPIADAMAELYPPSGSHGLEHSK